MKSGLRHRRWRYLTILKPQKDCDQLQIAKAELMGTLPSLSLNTMNLFIHNLTLSYLVFISIIKFINLI